MAAASKLPYLASAAASGLLFGAGLYVSQMINPLKVLRFLDFGAIPSGGWDPSLAFVIVPAIVVMFIAIRIGGRCKAPLFDGAFHGADFIHVDRPLVIGAALFGVGWGMSGICPGPAIALIGFLPNNLWIYLVAMFIGSYLGGIVLKRPRPAPIDAVVPAE